MPTYTYRCTTCTHLWDEPRPVDLRDTPSDGCPVCTNDYTVRLLTSPAITFKGSGFYTTDKRQA